MHSHTSTLLLLLLLLLLQNLPTGAVSELTFHEGFTYSLASGFREMSTTPSPPALAAAAAAAAYGAADVFVDV
jgi:hypothetical protein